MPALTPCAAASLRRAERRRPPGEPAASGTGDHGRLSWHGTGRAAALVPGWISQSPVHVDLGLCRRNARRTRRRWSSTVRSRDLCSASLRARDARGEMRPVTSAARSERRGGNIGCTAVRLAICIPPLGGFDPKLERGGLCHALLPRVNVPTARRFARLRVAAFGACREVSQSPPSRGSAL
jgi:hypothetical protein